ncbi:MAG: pantoate--beta-alanine ligase [Actinomycetota bacterium]|nr:pantoate--beta-alanine ligase [Actinomycetota bacterium]
MKVITEIPRMREIVEGLKREGRFVGLVPTMGYFHEGHLELMRRARSECDVVVVSLFVNPTQFGAGEDFDIYPRDLKRDCSMVESEGVDYLFYPSVEEMYPEGFQTYVEVEELSKVMCGVSRHGHFRGVATVVAKLFNIIPADRAYFGQKDAQQLVIIKRMAEDLNFNVEIIPVETVREPDGVAMSSRNAYLNSEERKQAVVLYRSLEKAREIIEKGERRSRLIREEMKKIIKEAPLVTLEYIVICDNIFLRELDIINGEVLIAIAARVGKARLIDNIVVDV